MSGVGGSLELIKPEHSSIRMVSEKVDIRIKSGQYNLDSIVRCEFIFRNEGKATTVKMGFPEFAYGDLADWPSKGKSGLIKFRSWVDGKLVKTHLVPAKVGDWEYKGWHLKEVYFATGQTRKVVDTYIGGTSGDVSGYIGLIYVLKTGASWKEKIGSAVITVDTSGMPEKYSIKEISPKAYKKNGKIIRWYLKNIEPKEDIRVGFMPVRIIGDNGAYFQPVARINKTSMANVKMLEDALDGLAINWNSGKCTMNSNKHKLILSIGSKSALLDGKKIITLPQVPYLHRNAFVVPVAAVVRALGGSAKLSSDDMGQVLKISLQHKK